MKIKDKNNVAIGGRIKEIRQKQKITQEALAEKVNLGSAQQISDIERGLCGLSVSKLIGAIWGRTFFGSLTNSLLRGTFCALQNKIHQKSRNLKRIEVSAFSCLFCYRKFLHKFNFC